ncbi:hypothetical protein DSCW_17610 [Desulfosarcina widdelii]|uniref:Uncharacterized protein n=1 Tax=Desulfosarcina widdelii TaxID=947919 RepID=A0A5K7Z792_9BACT|nr:hypothetical protein DSCW_17610 [Desulfosarcina widdelii]
MKLAKCDAVVDDGITTRLIIRYNMGSIQQLPVPKPAKGTLVFVSSQDSLSETPLMKTMLHAIGDI